jgi:hypothetical protein
VPDFHESGRQNVKQQTADKLDCIERHELLLVVVRRVSPSKRHSIIFHFDQSSVGNSDPMGVACQVLDHVLGAAKRPLGVDDPVLAPKLAKQSVECRRFFQVGQLAGKVQLLLAEGSRQESEKLASEKLAEYFDRQEESLAAGNPA